MFQCPLLQQPPDPATAEQAIGRLRRYGQGTIIKNYFYELEGAYSQELLLKSIERAMHTNAVRFDFVRLH